MSNITCLIPRNTHLHNVKFSDSYNYNFCDDYDDK